MEQHPLYIPIVFILTTLLSVWFLYKASGFSKITLLVVLCWLAVQAAISLTGFYTITNSLPPRFLLLLLPPFLLIIILFATVRGRRFIDSLNDATLTLLHVVRIPVELVLFWLFVHKAVPQLMTFEGRNLDILSGLTAPVIYYFGFVKKRLSTNFLIGWNIICLLLVINIMAHGILSVSTPLQQFAFDQPNIGVLYFPYVWLPGFIVPLVFFSHLAVIRRLVWLKRN